MATLNLLGFYVLTSITTGHVQFQVLHSGLIIIKYVIIEIIKYIIEIIKYFIYNIRYIIIYNRNIK